jgi:hypothetical protein
LVHVVYAPQPRVTQLRGQLCELQSRVSALCGQASPPLSGCVFERERDCEPVPHDFVHVVQAFH